MAKTKAKGAVYGWPWDDILSKTMVTEGGYVDDPLDRGGATKYGITLATYRDYLRIPLLTSADLSTINEAFAKEIYWIKWVTHPACQYHALTVNEKLCECLLDTAILFGRARANKWLQDSCNHMLKSEKELVVDGIIGPKTRTAAAECHTVDLVTAMVARRLDRHMNVCIEEPEQLRFLKGWKNRSFKLLGDLAPKS